MATLNIPVDSKKSDKRKVSNGTICSSNSSCILQKRKQLHPLAASIKYKNNSNSNNGNPVKQRVLSAKYLRFKTLQNELNDANYHIAQLLSENKLLKNLQKRQDHALARYEGTNAELPKMIESHQEEIRILQTKNKSLRKNLRELSDQIKLKDDEVNVLRDQNKHLMNLCKNKNLDERDKLTKKVEDLEDMLRQRDNAISTLNRKIVVESKNSKFKLNAEVNKNKSLQKELFKAQSHIEELTCLLEGRDVTTDKKIRRNTSIERKKNINKLNSTRNSETTGTSSDKKSIENISSSSLILSEENESTDINSTENNKIQKSDSNSENNDIPVSPTDKFSSVQQLKNVVHTWQKKNIDTLKENLDEYCSDILERANLTTPLDKLNQDYAKADKDMENLLSALKETDEIHKKFSKVAISSPVLDYTEVLQRKDKNANIVKKIHFEVSENDDINEINVATLQQKTFMDSIGVTNDLEEKNNQKQNKRYLESPENLQNSFNYDVSTTSQMYQHLELNGDSTFDLDFANLSKEFEINQKTNETNLYNIDENNFLTSSRKKNLFKSSTSDLEDELLNSHRKYNQDNDSTSDLDDFSISHKSHRSYKSEVGNEDKEKLLAKLKAIDNGENIEFSSVKKNKNDFIKELFG